MSTPEPPKVGTVGWMDLTVENADEVRDFYSSVAGWTSGNVAMGDYNDYGMQAPDGGPVVGGICHARGENAGLPAQWLIYITVADLDQSMARCREMGGQVIREPKSAGGYGRFCVIRDPGGAVAALFEPAS